MSAAWRLAAVLAALSSLGLSLVQLVGLAARQAWEPAAWLAATSHGRHYAGTPGAAALTDIIVILACALVASRERALPSLAWMGAAAGLFAASLIAWILLVLPMIEIMANWDGTSVPSGFTLVRDQWEAGHGVMAVIKLVGFAALAVGLAGARRTHALSSSQSPRGRGGLPGPRPCR